MWEQLTMVKESRGQLGVLATRHALYRMKALKWYITFQIYGNYKKNYILWEAQYQMKILL